MIHTSYYTKINTLSLLVLTVLVYTPAFGQAYDTLTVNKGELFASAAVLQDYDSDGDLDIVVTRKRSSGTTGGMEWLENDATGQFPRHVITDDLHEPAKFKAGDMDGDGDTDYVVSDIGSGVQEGELVLFQRQDDGSFIKWTVQANERFDDVELEDLDGDGDLDMAAVGFDLDSLFVWFNEGDINFNKTLINGSVNQLRVIEAVDVEGDGDIDILVDDMLLKNNGSGNFDDVTMLFTGTGIPSAGRDFVVEDLNDDGALDIITFRTVGLGGLYWLDGSNNFAHVFLEQDGVDLGGSIIVADLDNNGRKDIIRQNFGDEYVAVLYQNGPMSFDREIIEQNWDSEVRGSQMALGDLDNDGDPDLIFPEDGNVDGDISWFENIDGKLYRHYLHHEIQAPHRTRLGDMDGDGDLDIVVGAGNEQGSTAFSEREIVWYENRGSGNYIESRIEDNLYYPADLELADLDNDGMLDVIATGEQDGTLHWYKKNGPSWDRTTVEENGSLPRGIAIADIDGDGPLDIVLATAGDNKVFWYRNDGSGAFTRNVVDPNLSEPFDMEAADFNNDGAMDLAVIATDSANAVTIYTNDGAENFSREIIFTGHTPTDIEVGDWSGDDAPDIVVGFKTRFVEPENVTLFTNDGNGAFPTSQSMYDNNQELVLAVKLADTDNDEDLDIIFSYETIQPGLAILPNDGGVLGEIMLVHNDNPYDFLSIDAGDIDNDGDIDIVGAAEDTDSIVLFENKNFEPVAIEDQELPETYALKQNYPNPFNPTTQIGFTLSEPTHVELTVFDMLGRNVATLVDTHLTSGDYDVLFDAGNLPSGIYLYRLSTNNSVQTKKMILLR